MSQVSPVPTGGGRWRCLYPHSGVTHRCPRCPRCPPGVTGVPLSPQAVAAWRCLYPHSGVTHRCHTQVSQTGVPGAPQVSQVSPCPRRRWPHGGACTHTQVSLIGVTDRCPPGITGVRRRQPRRRACTHTQVSQVPPRCHRCPPVPAGGGRVEVPRSVTAVLGQDVVLPCRYRAQEQEQVVQVTWLKRGPGAAPAEVAVLNPQHGEHVQEPFAGRVLRHGHGDLGDGAIVLRNAVQGDEGDYECHLITFPMGSFEGRLTLRVLVPPLPILNPGPPLEEGQGRTLAASCTAEGSPVPSVRWETEVRGTNATRRSAHARSASVTSEFFLVPGRSMNGKSLTCVVAHPGLRHEKRITHLLSVAYLSDVSVLGHTAEWQEGMEGAALTCLGDGNPPPTYNWTRVDAPLPAGVRVKGDTLLFQRPLAVADAGDYVCRVSNRVAAKEARANVSIRGRATEDTVRRVDLVSASVVVVGVIAAVLLCVLVIVVVVMTLYHKRKTQRISEKYEEELTLTRENSIRRLHSSHSSDPRAQLEETLQLRTESRQGSLRGDSLRGDSLRGTSICSAMSEEPEGRSYSTLSTVREIETQTDVPVVSAVPAVPPPPAPGGKEPKEEEEEGGGGGDPIKAAMTHFVQENGMLQAKPSSNGIYINGRGHLV
ncbi:nectin-4 isoform X11 [Haemorhous mexicanus]|uniref:nectin-4 isoform X11 n=1 Tax=Haemorhous mexicanus TaxID=30427 RepID=UPI0028BE58B9|nr:nectin-4 isoform X11 [Haemorhous mexicanus]